MLGQQPAPQPVALLARYRRDIERIIGRPFVVRTMQSNSKFAIAAVIEHFSDAVVRNQIAGRESANAQLREWSTNDPERLPGLKFMRTLWVCDIAGGPQKYAATKPERSPWA